MLDGAAKVARHRVQTLHQAVPVIRILVLDAEQQYCEAQGEREHEHDLPGSAAARRRRQLAHRLRVWELYRSLHILQLDVARFRCELLFLLLSLLLRRIDDRARGHPPIVDAVDGLVVVVN